MQYSKALLPLCSFLLFCAIISAQSLIENPASASTMHITGTSTLHDWQCDVESFTTTGELADNMIKNIQFSTPVKSIKSGKGGMDKNMYKALKSDQFETIAFNAAQLNISGTAITGQGDLTVAGVTQKLPLELTYESWTEGSYMVSGSVTFNMSIFDIAPPTAMMGTIKTGDEITIHFEINLTTN